MQLDPSAAEPAEAAAVAERFGDAVEMAEAAAAAAAAAEAAAAEAAAAQAAPTTVLDPGCRLSYLTDVEGNFEYFLAFVELSEALSLMSTDGARVKAGDSPRPNRADGTTRRA